MAKLQEFQYCLMQQQMLLFKDNSENIYSYESITMLKIKKLVLLAAICITCQLFASLEEQLIQAAKDGQKETVQALLKEGANVEGQDSLGRTALMHAARIGWTDIVNLLLCAHAPVDVQDQLGQTALMWAASKGNELIVRRLLYANAKVDIHDKTGLSTVGHAGNNFKIISLLQEEIDNLRELAILRSK